MHNHTPTHKLLLTIQNCGKIRHPFAFRFVKSPCLRLTSPFPLAKNPTGKNCSPHHQNQGGFSRVPPLYLRRGKNPLKFSLCPTGNFSAITHTGRSDIYGVAELNATAALAKMDFSDADKIDDDDLNGVLWRALKHTDPPSPTRNAFVQ